MKSSRNWRVEMSLSKMRDLGKLLWVKKLRNRKWIWFRHLQELRATSASSWGVGAAGKRVGKRKKGGGRRRLRVSAERGLPCQRGRTEGDSTGGGGMGAAPPAAWCWLARATAKGGSRGSPPYRQGKRSPRARQHSETCHPPLGGRGGRQATGGLGGLPLYRMAGCALVAGVRLRVWGRSDRGRLTGRVDGCKPWHKGNATLTEYRIPGRPAATPARGRRS